MLLRGSFLKNLKNLTIAEASILAGSLKAPSRLSVINNKKASIERAKTVIRLLEINNFISQEQSEDAKLELESIQRKNIIQITEQGIT